MNSILACVFAVIGVYQHDPQRMWMFLALAGIWALFAIAEAIRNASKVKR